MTSCSSCIASTATGRGTRSCTARTGAQNGNRIKFYFCIILSFCTARTGAQNGNHIKLYFWTISFCTARTGAQNGNHIEFIFWIISFVRSRTSQPSSRTLRTLDRSSYPVWSTSGCEAPSSYSKAHKWAVERLCDGFRERFKT